MLSGPIRWVTRRLLACVPRSTAEEIQIEKTSCTMSQKIRQVMVVIPHCVLEGKEQEELPLEKWADQPESLECQKDWPTDKGVS